MRKKIVGIIIIAFLLLGSFVSADATCSFINITQGPPGVQGIQGINGTAGATGPQGPPGADNMTAGPQGIQGIQGIQGEQGIPGAANMTAGPAGANGTTPVFGVDYFNGTDGYTPVFGVDYFNGTDGAAGTAATITINSTVSGTPASVTNIGTITAALFDFVIPPGEKGDTGTIPDITQFLFLNGTRAMTGNLSMGSQYINNLGTPTDATDAATKGYVDTRPDSTYNASYLTSTFNATYDAKPDSTYNATYDVKVDTTNATYVLTGGSRAMSGNLSLGSQYINNLLTGTQASDAVNRSYVTGLGYITSTYNATYDAKPSSTFNSTYDAKPSSTYNTTYDTTSTTVTNNLNTWNATYNATYDAKIGNPIFGYTTLMAGSAMVTATNPVTMSQTETSSNKNNYISVDFTDGGSEVAQWIVDFPADWNSTGNVIFTPIWTTTGGSAAQTINLTVKSKLVADGATLDVALGSMGNSVDTWAGSSYAHVAPPTTGVAITGSGNTAIIAVNRNSAAADDTMSATLQLIGLRVKYVTNKA